MNSSTVPPEEPLASASCDDGEARREVCTPPRVLTWEQSLERFTEVLDDLTVDAGAVADQRAIRDAVDAVAWMARRLTSSDRRGAR